MNLILLFDSDFTDETIVRLTGRRLKHVLEVHRAKVGDNLCVGLEGGLMGQGIVTLLDRNVLEMRVSLDAKPPEKLPLTLVLALPRPKVIRRVIQSVATMGVSDIYLINTWRVEKSYWQSPHLSMDKLRQQLILGLEQGKDTVLPQVHMRRFFKPFVEDELPEISQGSVKLVAHPRGDRVCPRGVTGPVTLAVGPEGGFIDYEIDTLEKFGFSTFQLGPRILKVETAVPVLLAKLF